MIDTDKYERMLKDETYRLDGRNNMMALKLLEEVKRLREGLREIVSDFEIKKTDKWEMLFRIETILKGDD
jgi:hypothetical protein